jgi:hypothetical protein
MDYKSTTSDLAPNEFKANSRAIGLAPIASGEHERSARHVETPVAHTPKANWAWAESSGHFDWMDWHAPSVQPSVTDFDL